MTLDAASVRAKFWLHLTEEDNSPIIIADREGRSYLVRAVEIQDNEAIEIIWQDTQRTPFWASEKKKKETLVALKKVVPELTPERFNGITREFANAEADGNIEDLTPEYEMGGAKEGTLADELVRLALGAEIVLFRDDRQDAFAAVDGGGHTEVHAIRSRAFELWLRHLFFIHKKRGIAKENITDAVATLEAMGRFREDSRVINLNNRVAWSNGHIYYDLADPKWRAVKVTPEGWEVVDRPPILFRRWAHQRRQPDPERGGDVDEIFDFVNVKGDQERLIFKCDLVAKLVPEIPHPILIVVGPHGSAKTFSMKISRRLIDPSRTEILSFNYDSSEMALQLWQNYLAYYDNVQSVPNWLSNLLCRASTGEGFTKRKLYTDEDAIIFEFRRCVGLNGITLSPHRPDLIDRTLLLTLGEIPEEERKSETELQKKFKEAHPKIFGAILDILSKAMRIYPQISLDKVPRMADFAIWGEAIARAMGYEENEFLEAYRKNRAKQTAIVLELNPVGLAVIEFMKGRDSWEGRPSELLKILENVAQEHDIDVNEELWPKTATWVTRRIQEVRANLEVEGIAVSIERKNKRSWIILSVTEKRGANEGRGKNAGEAFPEPKGGKTTPKLEEFDNGCKKGVNQGVNRESGSKNGDSRAELKSEHVPPFVRGNASLAKMPLPKLQEVGEPEKPKKAQMGEGIPTHCPKCGTRIPTNFCEACGWVYRTKPTTQDIIDAVLSFSGAQVFKVKIAEKVKCGMDRLNVVLKELAQKRAVIHRGAMVEVL